MSIQDIAGIIHDVANIVIQVSAAAAIIIGAVQASRWGKSKEAEKALEKASWIADQFRQAAYIAVRITQQVYTPSPDLPKEVQNKEKLELALEKFWEQLPEEAGKKYLPDDVSKAINAIEQEVFNMKTFELPRMLPVPSE
jgi:hypothetical protein